MLPPQDITSHTFTNVPLNEKTPPFTSRNLGVSDLKQSSYDVEEKIRVAPSRVTAVRDFDEPHFKRMYHTDTLAQPFPQFDIPIRKHCNEDRQRKKLCTRRCLVKKCRFTITLMRAACGSRASEDAFPGQRAQQCVLIIIRCIIVFSILTIVGSLGVTCTRVGYNAIYPEAISVVNRVANASSTSQSDNQSSKDENVWNQPFPLFDKLAIGSRDFGGVGSRLDALLKREPLDMCATAAEVGEPVPYLVLRGQKSNLPNRHYVNAVVNPITVSSDRHGRAVASVTHWRTEIATHCMFVGDTLDTKTTRHSADVYERLVDKHLASTEKVKEHTRSPDAQAFVTNAPVRKENQISADTHEKENMLTKHASPSFLWDLHVGTQDWLSKGSKLPTRSSKKERSALPGHSNGVALPSRKSRRYRRVTIIAIDGLTGNNITQTLIGSDAFCAQVYHEIARGEWPCPTVEVFIAKLKEELRR
jgi:hypothetical protein